MSRTGRLRDLQVLVAQSRGRLRVHRRLDGRDIGRARVLEELNEVGPEPRLPAALEVVEAEYEAACIDQRLGIGLGHGIGIRALRHLVVRRGESTEVRPDCARLWT